MARPRKTKGESDRDKKRIHVAFAAAEFAAIAALADSEFQSLADAAHDLAVAGLAARNDGEAPKLTGLALAKETERDLRNKLLAIEVAKQLGEVISVNSAMKVVRKDYGNMRSRILNVPMSLPGATPEQTADLKKLMQDLMTDLSGENPATWDDLAAAGYEE
jgi:hypothetical protein